MAGQEIALNYVTFDSDLFERLAFLGRLCRSCICPQCLSQTCRCFSVRCLALDECSAPIPFDTERYSAMDCILCEKPYQNGPAMTLRMKRDFDLLQKSVWLLQSMQSDLHDNEIYLLDNRMLAIVRMVHPLSRELQCLLVDLCKEYIRRGKYDLAVQWRHWLAQKGLPLPLPSEDQLEALHELDQWIEAYLNLLPTFEPAKVSQYINEVKHIFKDMAILWTELQNITELKGGLLIDSEQFGLLMNHIGASIDANWDYFCQFRESIHCDVNDPEFQAIHAPSSDKSYNVTSGQAVDQVRIVIEV